MGEIFRKDRLLFPYLWKHRGTGHIKVSTKVGYVVYIQTLCRLGIVIQISTTHVKLKYVDKQLKPHTDWFLKSNVVHLLTGSMFVQQDPPEHQVDERLVVEKG